jgi:hypothetical protein
VSYGLDDWGSRVRFPAGAGNFSLHHRVQNGSGIHPASYPVDTRGPWMKLYLHSPNTPSWRGAQLKHGDNFTFREDTPIAVLTYHFLSFCLSVMVTMSKQERIILKYVTNETVKHAEVLNRLREQFGDETQSRTEVCDWSNSFKEGRTEVEIM